MDALMINKKGQLTLFIIIAIVIFTALVFLLFTYGPDIDIFNKKATSPTKIISECIEGAIEDSEKEFFESGGLLGESSISYKYNKQTIPFLCYSSEFYSQCIPQSPLFIESIRQKMENKVSRELSRCILQIREDYENKGYNFEYSPFEFELLFNEFDISYESKIPITISSGEEVIVVSALGGKVPTILPKILRTAESIVNYESLLCEFNYMTWQAFNREVSITRFRAGDQTKVYSLSDRSSDNKIKFAIRTCVMPAGI